MRTVYVQVVYVLNISRGKNPKESNLVIGVDILQQKRQQRSDEELYQNVQVREATSSFCRLKNEKLHRRKTDYPLKKVEGFCSICN